MFKYLTLLSSGLAEGLQRSSIFWQFSFHGRWEKTKKKKEIKVSLLHFLFWEVSQKVTVAQDLRSLGPEPQCAFF